MVSSRESLKWLRFLCPKMCRHYEYNSPSSPRVEGPLGLSPEFFERPFYFLAVRSIIYHGVSLAVLLVITWESLWFLITYRQRGSYPTGLKEASSCLVVRIRRFRSHCQPMRSFNTVSTSVQEARAQNDPPNAKRMSRRAGDDVTSHRSVTTLIQHFSTLKHLQ